MKNERFKILRCRCGWQRWHEEPVTPTPVCERCGDRARYSDDWYIKVWENGKRRIRAIAPQQRKTDQVLNRLKEDILNERFLKPRQGESPLLSEAIETVWRERWKKKKDGDKSKARAERWIQLVGDEPLDQIDEQTWRNAVYYLEESGLEGATVNRYRASLKTVLRRHKIDYSWMTMEAEPEGRIRVLTHEEEDEVIRIMRDRSIRRWPKRQDYRDEAADAVIVLVDTGMRPDELLQLPMRDVNFRTGLITIWINKTDKPRSIPMTDRVRGILKTKKDKPHPFTIDIHQLENAWEAAREKMGLTNDKDFVPYALRHTCATRLLESGEDIFTVQIWLGHKTIVTTRRYLHMDPKRLKKARDSLMGHRQQNVNINSNLLESHNSQGT